MDLCRYKDIFGVPGKGIHSYRIFGFATLEVLLLPLVALLIAYNFNYKFWNVFFILFILGIMLHRVFCVKTTLDVMLFG